MRLKRSSYRKRLQLVKNLMMGGNDDDDDDDDVLWRIFLPVSGVLTRDCEGG